MPITRSDFYSKKLDIVPDLVAGYRSTANMHIWDTVGQERFRSLGASFYRGADACIQICDISRQFGRENVLDWRRDFLKHADPDEHLPEHDFTESDMVDLITEIRKQYPSCPSSSVVMAAAENGSGVRQVFGLTGLAAVQRANENGRRFHPPPKDFLARGQYLRALRTEHCERTVRILNQRRNIVEENNRVQQKIRRRMSTELFPDGTSHSEDHESGHIRRRGGWEDMTDTESPVVVDREAPTGTAKLLRVVHRRCFLIESMLNHLLHLILVGVALSHEPDGSYFVSVSEPYLDLVYTFSDNAKLVKVSFYCGVGPKPTTETFDVDKVSDASYRIAEFHVELWNEFKKSFEKRCKNYLPLEPQDLRDVKYDTKFDHPSIHLKEKWWELAHREHPSH
ncbi:hypothetical protein Pmar_PMAR002456 [Perkinsus marinus ATCC 50983]|uniref:Uncharacterized protein n=1 Tax=Perkinsus marinus (strain ATCC 50983 / TXsc) TaxID=423536 RepID=C5KS68_PERM5|nr:hypothetical protein Pmar_PMAR002456 [Perkinsus marinus ATCC 50983]EER12649.1 hypothetical protein Pmar_PMAR002456 [Perkinsus marinus ATCC 50983]|eukprot:XP_002780854.1 hypothetical protein Pmar_PMAR002456 [Perkinsus marinus ATCC 50983]